MRLRDRPYVLDSQRAAPYFQWASNFAKKFARSRLGGKVYAFGGIIDHAPLRRAFYAPFVDLPPGAIGLEVCANLCRHLKDKKTITEKYSVCHFLGRNSRRGNRN